MPIQHLFHDPVLIVLMAASVVSWAIILDCLLVLSRVSRGDRAFSSGDASVTSPLSALYGEFKRHQGSDRDQMLVAMDTSIISERNKLERALPLLGVIGSTAPYMGLLGTVIGIIEAFQSIQAQNNMSPSIVAGGIATALVATACGLAVAIPSVAAHHLITSAIGRRVSQWESAVVEWIPSDGKREVKYESLSRA